MPLKVFCLASTLAGGSIKAIGMCIALAERYSNRFLDSDSLHEAELAGGRAALMALARTALLNDSSNGSATPGVKYVWKQ